MCTEQQRVSGPRTICLNLSCHCLDLSFISPRPTNFLLGKLNVKFRGNYDFRGFLYCHRLFNILKRRRMRMRDIKYVVVEGLGPGQETEIIIQCRVSGPLLTFTQYI